MRLGLGVVVLSLVWGVTADGDPQRRGPSNRRPAPPAPRPQQAPRPYDPNAYDPYTDPRQPPPTPPPGYDPYNRPQPAPQPYDPYNRSPQPYYPSSPQQPPPQPYYPSSPQQPPPQPQWNAPTPSQSPPPVTWTPPSPSTVPSPTPTPSPTPSPAPAQGTRQWNIDLATPPANARLPAPYNPPAAQECTSSNYGGSTYGGAPAITVAWPPMPEAYVPLLDITNGCGPGGPSVDPAAYYDLDVSTYLDSNTPEIIGNDPRFVVNFRKACLMHDVGYSGAKSYDAYAGVVRDFFDDTRTAIDDRFYADMVKECESQIPATANAARANCREYGGYHMSHGARTRYQGVSKGGEKVGAWKDRPNINGAWRIQGFPQAGTWTITQNKREVVAKWDGGTAAPDYRGEFRGTLISHDAWATIDGFYVVYDKGVPRCQPVPSSWRWEPGDRNKLTIKGPGSLTLVK